MAIRHRFTVKLRNGLPDLQIMATLQGGDVEHDPPRANDLMHVFREVNSSAHQRVVRTMHVHKDEVLAIVEDTAPPEPRVKSKK